MFFRKGLWGLIFAILLAAVCVFPGAARAQQRVFAKVEPNRSAISRTADVYSPSAGTIAPVSAAEIPVRISHTATLLGTGKVFVAGGYDGGFLDNAFLFDPAAGVFTRIGTPMTQVRSAHTATKLSDGKVLIAGGYTGSYLSSAEVFDPAGDSFAATSGELSTARSGHTAVLASDKVYVMGGFNGTYLGSIEVFDPSASTFSTASVSLAGARSGHTATLLQSGKVLIVGGTNGTNYLKTVELFDPATGTIAATGELATARGNHSATLLASGKVLIAGGTNGSVLDTAEIYNPTTGTFTAAAGKMTATRTDHAASLLSDGRVLVSGGASPVPNASLELFDEATGAFTKVAVSMAEPHVGHTSTVLPDGRVLLFGGRFRQALTFDVNSDSTDNVTPTLIFSPDGKYGYAPYTGSGVVVVFKLENGEIVNQIATGGFPALGTVLPDGKRLAIVSVLDDKVFVIDMTQNVLTGTYFFTGASFGFGSIMTVSADGGTGYVSSTGTGEVIRLSTTDFKETGRLKGLRGPAQITSTKDGGTLLVVDTLTEEVVFVDASALTVKTSFKAAEKVAGANFAFFHKVVLGPGGESAIIVSRDANGVLSPDTAFIISTANANLLDSEQIGSEPSYTGMTPDGKYWVVLGELSLSRIPTTNPAELVEFQAVRGDPLSSANMVFSPDSRYAYYVASEADQLYQHDLLLNAVSGQTQVGDTPDNRLDQPAWVAISPDGKTVGVLNVMSDSIELLRPVHQLTATRYSGSGRTFSGLSLVNLMPELTQVTITALDNFGQTVTGSNIVNPVTIDLWGNNQISVSVDYLFNFNPDREYIGQIRVESDKPGVIGHVSYGEARIGFLEFYLQRMDGAPMFSSTLHDFIIPELTRESGVSVEFDFVNPNYNQSSYTLSRYGSNGGLLDAAFTGTVFPTNRQVQYFSDMFTVPGPGSVFITGGDSSGTASRVAESYSTSSQVFLNAGNMTTARIDHTMTALPNGTVLIAGGRNASASVSTAEVYDRSTGGFTKTEGNLTVARDRHTATLLSNGKVLLIGGQSSGSVHYTAETYDPASEAFAAITPIMSVARYGHTATVLPTGKILIAGGNSGSAATTVVELFDPAALTFATTASMSVARYGHTATLLPSGKVLIAGGQDGTNYLNSAELYDPAAGTFASAGTMTATRQDHVAVLLADGRVFIAGGYNGTALDTAEVYDPANGTFTSVGTMTSKRRRATATLLPDRRVLIAGGSDGTNAVATANVFDPGNNSISGTNALSVARSGHAALFLESSEDGYLRITSDQGFVFTEYYGTSSRSAALNPIDMAKFSGVTSLAAPLLEIGAESNVVINLINGNTEDATVTMTLRRRDGTEVLRAKEVIVFRASQLKGDLSEILGFAGEFEPGSWLEIRSSVDQVVGTITLTNSEKTFESAYQLSGTPLRGWAFPLSASDQMFSTLIALVNGTADWADVTVEFWGPGGTVDHTATFQVLPGASYSSTLTALFPNMGARTVGNVRVRSSVPLHAMSLIRDENVNFLTVVPPVALPTASQSPETTVTTTRTRSSRSAPGAPTARRP